MEHWKKPEKWWESGPQGVHPPLGGCAQNGGGVPPSWKKSTRIPYTNRAFSWHHKASQRVTLVKSLRLVVTFKSTILTSHIPRPQKWSVIDICAQPSMAWWQTKTVMNTSLTIWGFQMMSRQWFMLWRGDVLPVNYLQLHPHNLMKSSPTAGQRHLGLLAKTEFTWSAAVCNTHYRRDEFFSKHWFFLPGTTLQGTWRSETLDSFHFGELKNLKVVENPEDLNLWL